MCSLPIRFSCLEWFLFSVSRCERARHARVSQHHFLVYFRTGMPLGKNVFSAHQILLSRMYSVLCIKMWTRKACKVSQHHFMVFFRTGIHWGKNVFSAHQIFFSRFRSLFLKYHLLVHFRKAYRCERMCSLLYDAFSFFRPSSLECILFWSECLL